MSSACRRVLSGCITRAQQAHGMHLARIDGYSLLQKMMETGEAVKSSPFAVGGRKWQLLVYPNGVDAKHRGFVSADLKLDDGEPAMATYRVSVIDHAGKPAQWHTVGTRRFEADSSWSLSSRGPKAGIAEVVATEELQRSAPFLLRNDCLSVMCDVSVLEMENKPRNSFFAGLDSAFYGVDSQ